MLKRNNSRKHLTSEEGDMTYEYYPKVIDELVDDSSVGEGGQKGQVRGRLLQIPPELLSPSLSTSISSF